MHPFVGCADYRCVLPLAIAMAMVVAPATSVDEPDEPPVANVEAPSEAVPRGVPPKAEPVSSAKHQREAFAVFTVLTSLSYTGLWLDLLIRKRKLGRDTIHSERYVFEDCVVMECVGPDPFEYELSNPTKIRLAALGGTPLLLTALSTTSAIGMGITLSRLNPSQDPRLTKTLGLVLVVAGSATGLFARYVPLSRHCWRSSPTCLDRRLMPTLAAYGFGASMLATGAGMLAYGHRVRVEPTVAITREHAQVGMSLRF